jgi:hypothetical protein
MGTEKLAAFGEAWQAMALQTIKSHRQLAATLMRSTGPGAASRGVFGQAPLARAAADWQQALLDILGQGLRPVHRRAVANARRLGRSKKR